jgi:hypothetical protein
MPKRKATNGKKRKVMRGVRESTLQARARVYEAARKRGIISSEKACEIGGWNQAWFHLNAMVKAGLMKRAGYNQWLPARRR